MINVVCGDGNLYRFPSLVIANEWLEENAELYGHDRDNVMIMTDAPPADSMYIPEVLHLFKCMCGMILKASVPDNIKSASIVCPNCGSEKQL